MLSTTLPRILQVAGLAWIALWACGPPTPVPPPVPFAPTDRSETALYGMASIPARAVCRGDWEPCHPPRPDLGLTFAKPGRTKWVWGLEGWAGWNTPISGGVSFRRDFLAHEGRVAGVRLAVGGLYGSAGVPLALQATPRLWIYTQPTLALVASGPFQVPAGVGIQLSDRLRMDMDVGWSSVYHQEAAIPDIGGSGFRPPARLWAAMGIAYRPQSKPARR